MDKEFTRGTLASLAPQEVFRRIALCGNYTWNAWRDGTLNEEMSEKLAQTLQLDILPRHNQPADFSGLDFTQVGVPNFSGMKFGDDACFNGATFGNEVLFEGAEFGAGAKFSDVTFGNKAVFFRAKFGYRAEFDGAIFGNDARFDHAEFGTEARFDGSVFGEKAQFIDTNFAMEAQFGRAKFGREVSFEKARFGDDACFDGATFGDKASFKSAIFGAVAHFEGTSFGISTCFTQAKFGEVAGFSGASFEEFAEFTATAFGDGALFQDVTFGECATFNASQFGRATLFERAEFGDNPAFAGTVFGAETQISDTLFGDYTRFDGATFGDFVRFDETTFKGYVDFRGKSRDFLQQIGESAYRNGLTKSKLWEGNLLSITDPLSFQRISFARCHFVGIANFSDRVFKSTANFRNANFVTPPIFTNVGGAENIDPTGIEVQHITLLDIWFLPWHVKYEWTDDSEVSARVRILRKLMEESKAHDVERRLFIVERRLERGALWKQDRRAAVMQTTALFLFRIFSNYGRSIGLPIVWWFAAFFVFHWLTLRSFNSFYNANRSIRDDQLVELSAGNVFPILGTLGANRRSLVNELFGTNVPTLIEIVSVSHSIVSVVLIFLFLLAIRNLFKIG